MSQMLAQPNSEWVDITHNRAALEYVLDMGPFRTCPTCNGDMVIMLRAEVQPDVYMAMITDCPVCMESPRPGMILCWFLQ